MYRTSEMFQNHFPGTAFVNTTDKGECKSAENRGLRERVRSDIRRNRGRGRSGRRHRREGLVPADAELAEEQHVEHKLLQGRELHSEIVAHVRFAGGIRRGRQLVDAEGGQHPLHVAGKFEIPFNSAEYVSLGFVRVTQTQFRFEQVVRTLVTPSNPTQVSSSCQKLLKSSGLLEALCNMLMASGVPVDVLTETINTVAEVIRGNFSNQEYFSNVMAPSKPPRYGYGRPSERRYKCYGLRYMPKRERSLALKKAGDSCPSNVHGQRETAVYSAVRRPVLFSVLSLQKRVRSSSANSDSFTIQFRG